MQLSLILQGVPEVAGLTLPPLWVVGFGPNAASDDQVYSCSCMDPPLYLIAGRHLRAKHHKLITVRAATQLTLRGQGLAE